MLSWNEFVLCLGAAVLGGALIGFERQWRSRGAGLRTNTLATVGRNDQQIEAAAGRLGLEPNVTSVGWHVVERDGRGAFNPDAAVDG